MRPDPDSTLAKDERAKRRALVREENRRFLAEHPDHPTIERVVDNRVFLLGLDDLYRERMKRHESTELLACARAVAAKLGVAPADVPIEGYYTETKGLREYFRLLRGLQAIDRKYDARVSSTREFQRLLSVASAPLYGRPVEDGRLLPVCRDPLAQAMLDIATETDVNADLFFEAADKKNIIGRCICIGETTQPERFYHWGIRRGADGEATVEEFWDTKLWTTEGYAMRQVLTRAPFAPTGALPPLEEDETT